MSTLTIRHLAMGVIGLIILALVNLSIIQTEISLRQGHQLFLDLAPVDPRSLIQGDYMRLNYAISNQLRDIMEELPEQGQVILKLDDRNVATFDRVYQGEALAANEILLNYRYQDFRYWVAPESFFFQEGHAGYYENARYGILQVAGNGQARLIGLADENLTPLGPPEE
jgi:uncharacterized membrane-anchored protein